MHSTTPHLDTPLAMGALIHHSGRLEWARGLVLGFLCWGPRRDVSKPVVVVPARFWKEGGGQPKRIYWRPPLTTRGQLTSQFRLTQPKLTSLKAALRPRMAVHPTNPTSIPKPLPHHTSTAASSSQSQQPTRRCGFSSQLSAWWPWPARPRRSCPPAAASADQQSPRRRRGR